MKIVTDDGLEIPFENLKVIDVKENQRIIFKINRVLSEDKMINIQKYLNSFFAPAKVLVVNNDVELQIIEIV